MYFFPSYVTYEERSGSVYISSKLLQNEIKISDSAFIQEFQDLIAKGRVLNVKHLFNTIFA